VIDWPSESPFDLADYPAPDGTLARPGKPPLAAMPGGLVLSEEQTRGPGTYLISEPVMSTLPSD
jgi:hypothetical protein